MTRRRRSGSNKPISETYYHSDWELSQSYSWNEPNSQSCIVILPMKSEIMANLIYLHKPIPELFENVLWNQFWPLPILRI